MVNILKFILIINILQNRTAMNATLAVFIFVLKILRYIYSEMHVLIKNIENYLLKYATDYFYRFTSIW